MFSSYDSVPLGTDRKLRELVHITSLMTPDDADFVQAATAYTDRGGTLNYDMYLRITSIHRKHRNENLTK